MGYVRKLSIPFLFRLITKASEKELEKQDFDMFCSVLPYLDKPMSFKEWRDQAIQKKKDNQEITYTQSTDDLVYSILGGGDNGII